MPPKGDGGLLGETTCADLASAADGGASPSGLRTNNLKDVRKAVEGKMQKTTRNRILIAIAGVFVCAACQLAVTQGRQEESPLGHEVGHIDRLKVYAIRTPRACVYVAFSSIGVAITAAPGSLNVPC
jgi:hypothetical protein